MTINEIIDELIKISRATLGDRKIDNKCIFCGEELAKGEYCTCLKSDKINSQARKINAKIGTLCNFDDLKIQRKDLFYNSGVPRRFKGLDFQDYCVENPKQKKVLDDVQGYFKEGIRNWILGKPMTLTGIYGTGKTMLSSILTNRLINDWLFNVRFINFQDFTNKVKSTFDNNSKTTLQQQLDFYKKADFLIFDDLDKIKPTEFVRDLLYNVIDFRYTREMPTIITANSSLEVLEEVYFGEASVSRVFQDGVNIKFEHDNWRMNH